MSLTMQVIKKMSNSVIEVPRAESGIVFQLPDGRSEKFKLHSTGPVEFIFQEPVKQANGDTTIDLEILKFEVEAESKVLWPGEKVRMSGGSKITHEALPIKGRVLIPAGKDLKDGVESIQDVYIQVETPLGTLHNTEAIPMIGVITGIPPKDSVFTSTTQTSLYDGQLQKKMEIYGCQSSTQTTY
ncbi:hypothetical protein [Bacillus toyonensis]|uniref:hypothetical protein n=1 Tax=Bacillus toyonensis TaxID=155322 RepID=UPI000BEF5C40|nr:hypothetical protein [Bacillus toyonensis]PEM43181.1 hypothetical protein CN636_17155 [Bacillus toyonensis]